MDREMRKRLFRLTAAMIVIVLLLQSLAGLVFAYFSRKTDESVTTPVRLNVNDLFGTLDPSQSPSGVWGSETNPYLIFENRHLKNLYHLQNSRDSSVINENSYFQVSTIYGAPCYVGGESSSLLFEMPSIGSEDFPFVANLRGITSDSLYATLPSGERSDTSVIGNILVSAYEGQIDIGLFGNVGREDAGAQEVTGSISNLLLANIQIRTAETGDTTKDSHNDYYVRYSNHETNHIGILAGHVSNAIISDISVYYSSSGAQAQDVRAFEITEGVSATKYTTAGGILGFYKNLIVNPDDISYRVNSLGTSEFGGSNVGLGQGIVHSEDIWTFMETSHFGGGSAPGSEYGIQEQFGEELYGAGNLTESYFQVGVFTFVHSTQMKSNDRIARLWRTTADKNWSVSTSNSYSASTVVLGEDVWADNADDYVAKRYSCVRVTTSDYSTYTSNNGYRLMIVANASDGNRYALVKYGATATHVKIDPSNFVIPEEQLNYYTFRLASSRSQNLNYPPYTENAAYTYGSSNGVALVTNNTNRYYVYGNNVPKNDGSGKYCESERPLRIYYSGGGTISFMAAASTSSSVTECVKMRTISGSSNTFRFQRVSNGSAYTDMNMSFSLSEGYYAVSTQNSTALELYAVKINSSSGGSGTAPVDASYSKLINTPTANIRTYDMSRTTLFYRGSGSNYDIVSIESLAWSDNDGNAIDIIETTLKMADPTSYYYIDGLLRGAVPNIKAPSGMTGTITVPEASIGFTVQGDGQQNSQSKVFVMVATDPSKLVDQTITISYFPTNASGGVNGDRTIHASFPLPSIPSDNAASAISVRDLTALAKYEAGGSYQGSSFNAYPNLNTLLVAYEFSVPSSSSRTYFLEASKGSANFVYLSAERTAAEDSNPNHENDVMFEALAGIDYVCSLSGVIAGVKSESYVETRIVPYFGLTRNPSNIDGSIAGLDALIVLSAANFHYGIHRYYDAETEMHTLSITITAIDYSSSISENVLKAIMTLMNFNFTDLPYNDPDTMERVYSDIVVITINNRTLDWLSIY